jgi:hypothetical protein
MWWLLRILCRLEDHWKDWKNQMKFPGIKFKFKLQNHLKLTAILLLLSPEVTVLQLTLHQEFELLVSTTMTPSVIAILKSHRTHYFDCGDDGMNKYNVIPVA